MAEICVEFLVSLVQVSSCSKKTLLMPLRCIPFVGPFLESLFKPFFKVTNNELDWGHISNGK